jgi:YVTN family beta-propeller protein
LKNDRKHFKLGYGALAIIAVAIFALPTDNSTNNAEAFEIPNIVEMFGFGNYDVITASADDPKTHHITMAADEIPGGKFGYKMISHVIVDEDDDEKDVTNDRYDESLIRATIPGPALVFDEGDVVILTLENHLEDEESCVSVHVHGVHYSIESDGTLETTNGVTDSCAPFEGDYEYTWTASKGSAGTWPYHDHTLGGELGSEDKGLFGVLIVNEGNTKALIDGEIGNVKTKNIDKEFVLYMVGTKFWGLEIDNTNNGMQTPLWTNPRLGADLNEIVKFHVLGLGSEFHTFHVHAHKWLEPGTTDVIDTKTIGPLTRHTFIIQAGEGVGEGDWMYHCHVFNHMQNGMSGIFDVGGDSEAGPSPYGNFVTFDITDEPGVWFKASNPTVPEYESLVIVTPDVAGDPVTVDFTMDDTNSVHTITSLLYPKDATNMPFDQPRAFDTSASVTLTDPGLYAFTCKVHPYMFGAVIVDDPGTAAFDLGNSATDYDLELVVGLEFPSSSDLATRLLNSVLVVTNPDNWQVYEDTPVDWTVYYPDVQLETDLGPVPLQGVMEARYGTFNGVELPGFSNPSTAGVGEVWINTQFEETSGKTKPGTITAINATTWDIDHKLAFDAGENLNHPHNMWSSDDQSVIYQTQWFDNKLSVFDRETGDLLQSIEVGDAPSHVMVRPGTNEVYVALNGDDFVGKYTHDEDGLLTFVKNIQMQSDFDPVTSSNPHGHWMNGTIMVTPNAFLAGSTIYDLENEVILDEVATGPLPLATGMMPDGSKYYVANLLSSTISVIETSTGNTITDINLMANYNGSDPPTGNGAIGFLPIQTPVSPDGRFVVTATLWPSITIVDTSTDTLTASLACDAGCHGVQWGAKDGGGYYAYVASKFSNSLIVVDPDPDGLGNGADDGSNAVIAGRISLEGAVTDGDTVTGLEGMGGQGTLAVPNVYNEWVQELPAEWTSLLTSEQQNPYP